MRVRRIKDTSLDDAYGIKMGQILDAGMAGSPPFGTAWGVVSPRGTTTRHRHHEHEVIIVLSGTGIARSDISEEALQSGDALIVDSFTRHTIVNPSDSDDLVFVSVYWECPTEQPHYSTAESVHPSKTAVISSTPPTPNGDLHLGHLSGPYLAADICRRYHSLRRRKAVHISGSDDYQSYVVFKADQLEQTEAEVARGFGDQMDRTLKAANIILDQFTRPMASMDYQRYVSSFFRHLYDSGWLFPQVDQNLYCDRCSIYLYEAFVSGRCPHCNEMSGGNICEACGLPNSSSDLVEPRCSRCGSTPSLRPVETLHFALGRARSQLAQFWENASISPRLRKVCDWYARSALASIPVTVPTDWGIPVPVTGYENQRIWVWFEMAPGYLFSADRALRSLQLQAGECDAASCDFHQFFGFDNGFYHAVLFPALFIAHGDVDRLPSSFVCNEFYLLNGEKFSTSRQHAVWGGEFLETVRSDLVRFHLCVSSPEVQRTNFTFSDLDDTIKVELAGRWQALLTDLKGLVEAACPHGVPEPGSWTTAHQDFYADLTRLREGIYRAYEPGSFSPQRATRQLGELVGIAHRFCRYESHRNVEAPLTPEARTSIALRLVAARVLAATAAPIMPIFAQRLWMDLGGAADWSDLPLQGLPSWVPSGYRPTLRNDYFDDKSLHEVSARGRSRTSSALRQ